MKELVDAGADTGATDDEGMTAVEIARSVYGEDDKVLGRLLGALRCSV